MSIGEPTAPSTLTVEGDNRINGCILQCTALIIRSLNYSFVVSHDWKDLTRDANLDTARSDHPLFSCFIVDEFTADGTRPIAFASFYNSYSTWEGKTFFLDTIFVREKHRGQGVGKRLFFHLAKYSKQTNCHRFDMHICKDNPAAGFFMKFNAVNLTETENWELFECNAEGESVWFSCVEVANKRQ